MSMTPSYWIGQGDSADPLTFTPEDADGNTANLSGYESVTFRMRKPNVQARKVDTDVGATVVDPGPTNHLQYDWSPADTDEPAVYGFYFLVAVTGGATRRFPNKGYAYLEITAS